MKDDSIELPPLPQGEYRLSPDSRAPTLYDEEAMEVYARAAIDADRKQRFETRSSLERYLECGGDEELDPIERLRFFCSISMSGQDWLDVERFFDDVIAERKQRGEPVAWRPVQGYECRYEVSEHGQIRRTDGKLVGLYQNSSGYLLARLSQPRREVRAHRVVAEAFIPNPLNLPYVNHIDCDPKNNHAKNLEWCTQKQNLAHSRALGRMQADYWKGKRSPNASLSDETANQIRRDRLETGLSWEALAEKHGTNKRTVGRILRGEAYV